MLSNRADDRCANRSARSTGSSSPPTYTNRSDSGIRTPESARNTASIDGTNSATVMSASSISDHRYSGSRCPSGRATTSFAPTAKGRNSSHTETSKVIGALCTTTSAASNPYSAIIHASRLPIARCETATPLGRPVEPEVKITYAVFSVRTGATRSASRTGASENPDTSRVSTSTAGTDPGVSKPSRLVVSTHTGAAVSSTYVLRSTGWSGSSGTYPPPASSTAQIPTTISIERPIATPTSDSGPTPREIRYRANRLTRASSSAYVS